MSNPFSNNPGPTATATPPAASGGFSADTVQSGDPYSVNIPTGVSGVRMNDPGILNELLLVEPVEYIASMMTSASKEPTDAFRVNILPLTGGLAGELQEDVMIFQVALKRELMKTYRGPNRWLLARCQMGTAKPGQSAPYLFNPPGEDDLAIFNKFKATRGA